MMLYYFILLGNLKYTYFCVYCKKTQTVLRFLIETKNMTCIRDNKTCVVRVRGYDMQ